MFSSLFGRQGDKGDTGDTGAKGDTGDTGAKGDKGDTGDAGASAFVNRGDPNDEDYDLSELTRDGAYHDMNISAIVGAAVRLVLLRVRGNANAADKVFKFKTKGQTNDYNIAEGRSQVANVTIAGDFWVLTDASGVCEYNFDTAFANSIFITVGGWFA